MGGPPTTRAHARAAAVLAAAAMLLVAAGCGQRGAADDGASASGEERVYNVRYSHVSTPESGFGQAAEIFKRKVAETSDGQIEVEVFPNSTLYGQEDELQALQAGSVEMVAPTVSVLTSASPEFFLFDLPFVFDGPDDVMQILEKDTAIGKAFFENEDLAERGMKAIGIAHSGFKHLTSNTQMRTPEDLRGLKMRVQPSNVLRDMMRAWGANATPMPFAELYNGLQQGVVDGQDNPYTSIFTTKVFEVQDHLTETAHGYNMGPILVNQDFFDSLPEHLQQAMIEAGEQTGPEGLEYTQNINVEDKQKIEDSGETEIYVPTEEERQAFKDAAVPALWDQYAPQVGQELIDELKSYYGM